MQKVDRQTSCIVVAYLAAIFQGDDLRHALAQRAIFNPITGGSCENHCGIERTGMRSRFRHQCLDGHALRLGRKGVAGSEQGPRRIPVAETSSNNAQPQLLLIDWRQVFAIKLKCFWLSR